MPALQQAAKHPSTAPLQTMRVQYVSRAVQQRFCHIASLATNRETSTSVRSALEKGPATPGEHNVCEVKATASSALRTAQRNKAATAFWYFSRASRFLRLALNEIACSALSVFTLLGVTWADSSIGAGAIIADALFSSCFGAARKLVQLHLHKHEHE